MPIHRARRPARLVALLAASAVAASGLAASPAAAKPEKLGPKEDCWEGGQRTSHGGLNKNNTKVCDDGEWKPVSWTTTMPSSTQPSGPTAPDTGPAAP